MACRSTAKSPLSPPVQPPDPPAQSSPGMNRHSSQLCPLTARPVRLALPVSSMQPLFIIPSPPYKCLKGPQTPLPNSSTPAITGTLISPASAEMDGSCDNLEDTELRLGLPGIDISLKLNKRALTDDCALKRPSSKAQVVGWPPVRSNRKNSFQTKRSAAAEATGAGIFVKVSMDGAPYLRKIDLKNYKGYKELRDALEDLFKIFSFSLDAAGTNGTEHTIAYEDKDGDWMLAGDVPWEMFISSCRRLRIMKGSEAKGLASNP